MLKQHYKCEECGYVGFFSDFEDWMNGEESCPMCLNFDFSETDEPILAVEEDED